MSLLIKNGEVVTATDRYHADIFCEGETITAIGKDLDVPPDAEVIDAKGKYVFPGFIDPHVHIFLPFMGTYAKDTYETASKAALIGGTTCFIDFAIPMKNEEPMDAYELWKSKSDGQAACDFSLHMAVTRYDDKAEAQIREIVKDGITSFKVFLAYPGAFGVSDEELYKVLKLGKELGVITCAHCENADIIAQLQQKFLAEGKTGTEWHYHSRPPLVEAEGTRHFFNFAHMLDAAAYVVHLSCDLALKQALEARYRGTRAYIEVVAPHLMLDKTYAERPDFEGAKYVMSPPLREKWNQDVLWNALGQGIVNTVGTDHAPFDFEGQKPMGKDNFTLIPNGIPAIENRINLLYSYGVQKGKIDLQRLVDCASTQAARIFGLFPRKGCIAPGSDADLVVYDPDYRGTLSIENQAMNVDYCAFEGWEITGRPSVVTVRGEVAARDGKFVGTVGRGKLLKREPTHF